MGKARSLSGSRPELEIAQPSAATFQQNHLLSVIGYITNVFACLGIIHHGSARNVDIRVLTVGAMTLVSSAISAVFGIHVLLILQVKQRPEVMVSTQNDVTSMPTITAIRASVGLIFDVFQVHRASSALARTAYYSDIIYEIRLH